MRAQRCYLITRCENCKIPFYFKALQKTKRCPNCNKLLILSKLNILYKADSAEEALRIVLKLKQPDESIGIIEASKIIRDEEF